MRVSVELTEQEWRELQQLADLESRPLKYQAAYLLSKALSSEASEKVRAQSITREAKAQYDSQ